MDIYSLMEFFGFVTDLNILAFFSIYFQNLQPFMILEKTDDDYYISYIADIYKIYYKIDDKFNRIIVDQIELAKTRLHRNRDYYSDVEIIIDEYDKKNDYIIVSIPKGFSVLTIKIKYKNKIQDNVYEVPYSNICDEIICHVETYLQKTLPDYKKNRDRINKIIDLILIEKTFTTRILLDIALSIIIEEGDLEYKELKNTFDYIPYYFFRRNGAFTFFERFTFLIKIRKG